MARHEQVQPLTLGHLVEQREVDTRTVETLVPHVATSTPFEADDDAGGIELVAPFFCGQLFDKRAPEALRDVDVAGARRRHLQLRRELVFRDVRVDQQRTSTTPAARVPLVVYVNQQRVAGITAGANASRGETPAMPAQPIAVRDRHVDVIGQELAIDADQVHRNVAAPGARTEWLVRFR